jgi:phage-related protein
MAWDTWVPPQQPGQNGTQFSEQPRLLQTDYGDGYSQVLPDGINYITGQADLNWNSILATNWATIVAFFEAHLSLPFLWTLPDESVPRQWRAQKWSKGYGTNIWLSNCQATIVIDFTPG